MNDTESEEDKWITDSYALTVEELKKGKASKDYLANLDYAKKTGTNI